MKHFIILFLFVSSSHTFAMSCKELILGEGRLDEGVLAGDPLPPYAQEIIKAFPPNILANVRPSSRLKWNDFDQLNKLATQLEEVTANAESSNIISSLNNSPIALQLRSQFEEASRASSPVDYGATGHGLQSSYRQTLMAAAPVIGSWFFSNLAPLPSDDVKAAQYDLARRQIKRMEDILASRIFTTGYDSMELFRKAAQDSSGFQDLRNGKFELAMRRPERGRWWIERVGFHNQFITESSEGYLNPEFRRIVEAGLLGLAQEIYDKYSPDLAPKYGILIPPMATNDSATHYGEDTYIFKKSRVSDRVTLTLGDSLNEWSDSVKARPRHWNEYFVPYKFIDLFGPFISSITHFVPKREPNIPMQFSTKLLDRSYMEVQYFGPLTLDDVESFIFRKEPPSGSFLQALKSRNIKIYKSLGGIAELWEP